MSILLAYSFFALVTAIMAMFEIFLPVVKKQQETTKVEYKYIIYFTSFLLSILAAPLVFLACIFAPINVAFRDGFAKGVFQEE